MKKKLVLHPDPHKKVVLNTPTTVLNALKFMMENSYLTKMMMMKNLMMKMIPMTKKKMMTPLLVPPQVVPVHLVLLILKKAPVILLPLLTPLKVIMIAKVQEIPIVVTKKITLLMKVKLKLWLTKTVKLKKPTVPKFMVETMIGIMNKAELKVDKDLEPLISKVLLKTGPHTNTIFSQY
jgi:hypothetical protein